jgi:rare lipoprotein A
MENTMKMILLTLLLAFSDAALSAVGIASWYGPGFHGKKTASGKRFNMNALTAAHRKIPLGSRVRVENLRTKLSTVVRITDRGPYARGRIIDLSKAAALAIGMVGTDRVRLTILEG